VTAYRNWQPRSSPSPAARLLNALLWLLRRFAPRPFTDVQLMVAHFRRQAASSLRLFPKTPSNVVIERFDIGGTPACWVRAPGASTRHALFYLQGGGHILGSPDTAYRDLIWRLSSACGCPVLAIEYALAPEHRFPTALEQAVAAYRFLLESFPPHSVAMAGDSAGGNLALAATLKLRDAGLALPAALCLLSPWTDLTGSGSSVARNQHKDHFIPAYSIPMMGRLYAGGAPLDLPYVSPVFGDFTGFPPTLFQAGSDEVFLDDSLRVADKMRASGVPVVVDVWRSLPHVWQGLAAYLPEGRAAIEDIARFVSGHVRAGAAAALARPSLGNSPPAAVLPLRPTSLPS